MTRSLLDAFWRAVAYCLHPKVIVLSPAPLAVVGGGRAARYLSGSRRSMRSAARSSSGRCWLVFAWLASVGAGASRACSRRW
jgi:hypothetical protein